MHQLKGTFLLPRGSSIDARVLAVLARRWNHFRILPAAFTIVAGGTLWLLGFHRAWIAITTACVLMLHALGTRARPRMTQALAVDIVLSFLTLWLLAVPLPAVTVAYVAYGVITTLTSKPVARAALGLLASALFAGAAFVEAPGIGVASTWLTVVGWLAAVMYVSVLFAVVAMTVDLLQDQVREADLARDRVATANRSKDELLAAVSHELRTPLATVLGFATELRDRWETFSPQEQRELSDLIADESHHLTYIIEDLVVAARDNLGILSVRLEPRLLHAEVAAALRDEVSRKCLSDDLAGGDVRVDVDPVRFRQILRNLVRNAAIHGGDRVWVEMAHDAESGIVRVRDNGGGIPKELQELVFAPYQRVPGRVPLPASFGLGLTISRRLAEAMGGTLTYRDSNGSIFELTVRRTQPQAATVPGAAAEDQEPGPGVEAGLRPLPSALW